MSIVLVCRYVLESRYEEWLSYVVFGYILCLGSWQQFNGRKRVPLSEIVPKSFSSPTHFLAAVGGQVEHEHGEKGDAHAGYYEVDSVEERLAPHRDVESNIEVGLGAACVIPETRRSKSVTYSTPTWQSR